MVLYTRNLIPKIPARILGKHCQVMFLRTFGKPKAPNTALSRFGDGGELGFFSLC
jgi:hypothetical protein